MIPCYSDVCIGSRVFVRSSAECSGRKDLYSCAVGQVQKSILHHVNVRRFTWVG